MKRTPLKKIGKRGKEKRKRMDALTNLLFARSGGRCEVCGKLKQLRKNFWTYTKECCL